MVKVVGGNNPRLQRFLFLSSTWCLDNLNNEGYVSEYPTRKPAMKNIIKVTAAILEKEGQMLSRQEAYEQAGDRKSVV